MQEIAGCTPTYDKLASRGPLVDANGRVVGVVSAMASVSATSGSIGIGFAIPIESALDAVAALTGSASGSVAG